MPVSFIVPQQLESDRFNALPLVWARSTIADHMRVLNKGRSYRRASRSNEQITQAVTKLGLDFSLMTQWTSFVAVSEKIVNTAPHDAAGRQCAAQSGQRASPMKPMAIKRVLFLPMAIRRLCPTSCRESADAEGHTCCLDHLPFARCWYEQFCACADQRQKVTFGGSSTPEPATNAAMLLLLLMMLSGWMVEQAKKRHALPRFASELPHRHEANSSLQSSRRAHIILRSTTQMPSLQ